MLNTTLKNKNKLLLAMLVTLGVNSPINAAENITDLHVNKLITHAIQTHPLIKSAEAEQVATTEGVSAAKLGLLPDPSFSTTFNEEDDLISKVNVRQPLWTGGRLTANVNQAIFDEKAAKENVYEQQNEVAKTTIDAWQSYIAAISQQQVYLQSLRQLYEFEQMMKRRVKQGVSARIDLELVSNRILQEQNSLDAAIEQQQIAAARLEQITGYNISNNRGLKIPDLRQLVEQAKLQSAEFEQMAFNGTGDTNPAVIKQFFQVQSAIEESKAQRASRYPTLFAQYEHEFNHEENTDDGQFFIGLNYEPGAGFSNVPLTKASEARVQSLEENQKAAERSVLEEIQVQYQQFASAKGRELSLVNAAAGAQIVVSSYQRQFKAGRKSWLEVLNAVREHTDYQIKLVQTRSEILGSFYKLQVDFSLMPWQRRFNDNREDVQLFSVADPVHGWLNDQNKEKFGHQYNDDSRLNMLPNSDNNIYYPNKNNPNNFDSNNYNSGINESRANVPVINLPESIKEDISHELDKGFVIQIKPDNTYEVVNNTQQLDPSESATINNKTANKNTKSLSQLTDGALVDQNNNVEFEQNKEQVNATDKQDSSPNNTYQMSYSGKDKSKNNLTTPDPLNVIIEPKVKSLSNHKVNAKANAVNNNGNTDKSNSSIIAVNSSDTAELIDVINDNEVIISNTPVSTNPKNQNGAKDIADKNSFEKHNNSQEGTEPVVEAPSNKYKMSSSKKDKFKDILTTPAQPNEIIEPKVSSDNKYYLDPKVSDNSNQNIVNVNNSSEIVINTIDTPEFIDLLDDNIVITSNESGDINSDNQYDVIGNKSNNADQNEDSEKRTKPLDESINNKYKMTNSGKDSLKDILKPEVQLTEINGLSANPANKTKLTTHINGNSNSINVNNNIKDKEFIDLFNEHDIIDSSTENNIDLNNLANSQGLVDIREHSIENETVTISMPSLSSYDVDTPHFLSSINDDEIVVKTNFNLLTH